MDRSKSKPLRSLSSRATALWISVVAFVAIAAGVASVHEEARSDKWPAVRKAYLEQHPKCEVEGCGATEHLNVHHIHPFHKYPKLELDPRNLVTLCADGSKHNHHLKWGHLDDWSSWNVNIRAWCAHPPTQEEIDKATKSRPK